MYIYISLNLYIHVGKFIFSKLSFCIYMCKHIRTYMFLYMYGFMSINDMYVKNVNIYICVHVSLFQYTYVFEIIYIDMYLQ